MSEIPTKQSLQSDIDAENRRILAELRADICSRLKGSAAAGEAKATFQVPSRIPDADRDALLDDLLAAGWKIERAVYARGEAAYTIS